MDHSPATLRRNRLLAGLEPARLRGMEIGALASPLVRRAEGDILYVDHADTPTLRAKYATDGAVDLAGLVEVDIVWGGNSLATALGTRPPVDYVLASHVMEHVPDLLGWLAELRDVLRPQGTLRVAVPDRRFTFDYLRRESRLSDLVDASLRGTRVPLPSQILDHVLEVIRFDPTSLELAFAPEAVPRLHTLQTGIGVARDSLLNNAYHDVHCWVFTPRSFAALLGRAAALGLHRFACLWLDDTRHACNEFLVALQVCDDPDAAAASWQAALQGLEDVDERPITAEIIRALASERDAALARIAALEASRSWRLTQPLRAIATAFGRRARRTRPARHATAYDAA
jgi:SAM-dependent methyltransferase